MLLPSHRTPTIPPSVTLEGRRSVEDVVSAYLEHYPLNHRRKSVLFASQRLAHASCHLGNTLLPDLTENALRSYMRT